ncbi:MAG: YitT family protein [Oscillospiraceae bacterium]
MKKPTMNDIKNFAIDTAYDIVGSILFAIGIYVFAKSANFAPGGVSGLALIFNHLYNVPIGTMSLLLNIPIVLISFKLLGKKFFIKSLRTMLISTLFLDVVFPLFPVYKGDSFLAAIFSGVFVGAGLAIIYMRGSSTGGADFLIISIKKLVPHLSIGQITLVTDVVIIALGGLVFRNIDALLYGAISTFATSAIIDNIMYGAGSGKLAIIITTDGMTTATRISEETERGSTLVRAIGPYSGTERHLLLCACSKSEIIKVRNAAHSVDPTAFVMITEASEVFGEGFNLPEIKENSAKK